MRTLIRAGSSSPPPTSSPPTSWSRTGGSSRSAPGQGWTADTVIDATGKYVIPGGVDAHTHMEMPFGGTFAVDTFETGTRAAAWGGTTTIVDFAIQQVGGTLREGLDAWHAKADGQCAIDYAFHMILADVNEGSLKEMEQLVGEGVTSFKLFMAYPGVFYSDDGKILRAMQRAAENGGAHHDARRERHRHRRPRRAGAGPRRDRPALPRRGPPRAAGGRGHPPGDPAGAGRRRAPLRRAPLGRVGAGRDHAARDEGFTAFGETCPQYLFLSTDDLARPDFEGAKYVCSTPLRPVEHQAALWRGLRTDDLSVVSTDHCPFCFKGQKELGVGDFSKIPNGLPGVENRMDLLHQGVVDGHISRRRWIEIACATPGPDVRALPAQGHDRAGRRRRRRHLRPRRRQTLSASTHHMAVDYSCYEGKEITGKVETVLSRGRVVIDGGEYRGSKGHGRFLPRDTCGYLR